MLQDTERKVLRVLYNYFAQNRTMPSWVEATSKMGKSKEQVITLLNNLKEQGYINWDGSDLQTIVMLQKPEQTKPISNPNSRRSGADYFTDY